MSPPLELTASFHPADRRARHPFAFVAERLWLDFVNTDTGARGTDALHDFARLVSWLEAAQVFDAERANAMQRRALQQRARAPCWVTRGGCARSCEISPSAAPRRVRPGSTRSPRSIACSAAAPARAVSSCATTVPSLAPSW